MKVKVVPFCLSVLVSPPNSYCCCNLKLTKPSKKRYNITKLRNSTKCENEFGSSLNVVD